MRIPALALLYWALPSHGSRVSQTRPSGATAAIGRTLAGIYSPRSNRQVDATSRRKVLSILFSSLKPTIAWVASSGRGRTIAGKHGLHGYGTSREPARASEAQMVHITRRGLLLGLSALAAPTSALAAVTGGGASLEQFSPQGGKPPKIPPLAKLTKGEPSPEELQRLAVGYQRLEYLLKNWERQTTVCIKGCKGYGDQCGCVRDPIVVQQYMGYKSTEDPLFKAGDLMMRASTLVDNDAEYNRYVEAMERWNQKAESGNVMAYVSSWGEANPGGGQDQIEKYLERSRSEVVESAKLIKTVLDILRVPIPAT